MAEKEKPKTSLIEDDWLECDDSSVISANGTPISDALLKFLKANKYSPDKLEADCIKLEKNYPPGKTEIEFPGVALKPPASGAILWPRSKYENRDLLRRVIGLALDKSENPPHVLFLCMVRDMLATGREPWRGNDFNFQVDKAFQELGEKEEAELKARNSIAGRKPTDKTGRTRLIMETLRISRSRAYDIEQNGIGNFEDRKALAAAFRDDPKRSYPGAWELAHGGRHGRPRGRPTFAAYVNSGDADFDGYPAFETIKAVCRLGAFPETFRDSDAFIAALETCGIDARQALAIWRIGGPWRDPDQSCLKV